MFTQYKEGHCDIQAGVIFALWHRITNGEIMWKYSDTSMVISNYEIVRNK